MAVSPKCPLCWLAYLAIAEGFLASWRGVLAACGSIVMLATGAIILKRRLTARS